MHSRIKKPSLGKKRHLKLLFFSNHATFHLHADLLLALALLPSDGNSLSSGCIKVGSEWMKPPNTWPNIKEGSDPDQITCLAFNGLWSSWRGDQGDQVHFEVQWLKLIFLHSLFLFMNCLLFLIYIYVDVRRSQDTNTNWCCSLFDWKCHMVN